VKPAKPSKAGKPSAKGKRAPAPSAPIAVPAAWTSISQEDSVPSFVGMSLRRALDVAAAEGLAVEARGSGFVVGQNPPAGTPRADGHGAVSLFLEPSA
jgi:hypothetical protein